MPVSTECNHSSQERWITQLPQLLLLHILILVLLEWSAPHVEQTGRNVNILCCLLDKRSLPVSCFGYAPVFPTVQFIVLLRFLCLKESQQIFFLIALCTAVSCKTAANLQKLSYWLIHWYIATGQLIYLDIFLLRKLFTIIIYSVFDTVGTVKRWNMSSWDYLNQLYLCLWLIFLWNRGLCAFSI